MHRDWKLGIPTRNYPFLSCDGLQHYTLLFTQCEVKQVEKQKGGGDGNIFKAVYDKCLYVANRLRSTQTKPNTVFFRLQPCVEAFQELA